MRGAKIETRFIDARGDAPAFFFPRLIQSAAPGPRELSIETRTGRSRRGDARSRGVCRNFSLHRRSTSLASLSPGQTTSCTRSGGGWEGKSAPYRTSIGSSSIRDFQLYTVSRLILIAFDLRYYDWETLYRKTNGSEVCIFLRGRGGGGTYEGSNGIILDALKCIDRCIIYRNVSTRYFLTFFNNFKRSYERQRNIKMDIYVLTLSY